MPVMRKAKHETIAQERYKGASWWKAAEIAGFSRHSVHSLRLRPDILARIDELKGAPRATGDLILMWQGLLDRAIAAKDLAAEARAAKQITLLSGVSTSDRSPAQRRSDKKDAVKATKKRKAANRAQEEADEIEEPDGDGITEPGAAPDVQALDRLFGRLDNDTRNADQAQEAGHSRASPAKDARGDYRHE